MITVVIGKPGTGKSYHCTRYLVNYLTTLARKNQLERKIFTNLSVNVDAFQKYFDRRHIKIDVSDVLVVLDSEELRYDENRLERGEKRLVKRGNKEFLEVDPSSKAFFWNRFPDNALIIIDEIQKYLSNIVEVGDSEEQSLVEYFSLHRHKRHDWIFLTQNLQSLSISVRRVTEKIVECLNSKSLTLPFPLSIPLRDIQTLLLGFGIENQIYRVREGRLDGTYRVDYDGPTEAVVMKKEIFDLYRTHTLLESDSVGVSSDSEVPFDLGKGAPLRAIKWFAKKHWFHLTLKTAIGIFIVNLALGFFDFMKNPDNIGSLLKADVVSAVGQSPAPVVKKTPVFEDLPQEYIDTDIAENINYTESIDSPAPISKVIIDGAYFENGKQISVGEICADGQVLKSVSTRYGAQYEKAIDYYYGLFDDVARLRRWLRYEQRQRIVESSEGSDL